MVFPDPCPGGYGAVPLLIEAPALIPWRFGLTSVATVLDETDDHARNGVRYKAPACVGTVQPWVDDCDSDNVDPKTPTDTDEDLNPYEQDCPFHLYAALSCKTTTLEAMAAEVRQVFDIGQQAAVEEQVWTNLLATANSTVLNDSSDPADALSISCAIATLESAINSCYGGNATIHLDRGLGAIAARERQVHTEGTAKYSELGSAMAFYGGSPNTGPDGDVAPDGYAWIYGTGHVTLRRFPVDVLPNEVNQRIQYDPLTNEPYVLAERTYVASADPCCRFAVLVELCGS